MCYKILPEKVCICCNFDIGVQVLVIIVMVLRLAGIVCSCFYGPYLYLVITLGSVYLAADFLLLYSLFWKSDDGKPSCDFTNQKVWIMIWQVCNIGAVLGLAVALGWYLWLGFWAMLHVPVHFVVFLIIVTILPVLIYTSFILLALFSYLKEAYIDSILGKGEEDENEPGLTSGGRRISV
eukprot:TRINITY_DN38588_c0_g1_i1.p1 TRINITY_DN38588_c0_g1~~TRINITY_DN38588_c0_g1_i1.p1  ORF type:complete len:180 (+),score=28.97 TRINITY_DN38588_c0_g1_i1:153-692(+)